MVDASVIELETAIKQLPGVLGCVILTEADGRPAEVQAFMRAGSDRIAVQRDIMEEISRSGLGPVRQVFVFELDAESHFGDRESLARAAEVAEQEARARGPADVAAEEGDFGVMSNRPPINQVVLTSSSWRSEAKVALGKESGEVVGEAAGEKTPHGLRVLAEATLEAAGRLVDVKFELKGASLVETFGRQAILVLVDVEGQGDTLGAALVRADPISDAAVRATLDAINRRLGHES